MRPAERMSLEHLGPDLLSAVLARGGLRATAVAAAACRSLHAAAATVLRSPPLLAAAMVSECGMLVAPLQLYPDALLHVTGGAPAAEGASRCGAHDSGARWLAARLGDSGCASVLSQLEAMCGAVRPIANLLLLAAARAGHPATASLLVDAFAADVRFARGAPLRAAAWAGGIRAGAAVGCPPGASGDDRGGERQPLSEPASASAVGCGCGGRHDGSAPPTGPAGGGLELQGTSDGGGDAMARCRVDMAATATAVAVVEALLARGAEPDAVGPLWDGSAQTALLAACTRGDLAVARVLLEAGADPDARSLRRHNMRFGISTCRTPLAAAAAGGHDQVEQLLLHYARASHPGNGSG
ncbi:hypothetical protein GPECTOR_18g110 [Gonium pectorale]|uniref:Uncharacterized protein n=1 Tax=Gonium pectorale TaxID=33097 RepID=A0A150GJH5_GONPE|nr:hypothetical protein GPECTOR_18g110 [Gonium pectorale]|eukprot:KXZ49952.1 hypothetical protein GPECTOR_18g110 [Gonium pectorale]